MKNRALTPEQKKQITDNLLATWLSGDNHHLRLGQLICNLSIGKKDLFYIEDYELNEALNNFKYKNPESISQKSISLKSSLEKLGKKVTQIIHFSKGNKRTFEHILTDTIKQGEFTKMETEDRLILVNPNNVDCIEVFKEN